MDRIKFILGKFSFPVFFLLYVCMYIHTFIHTLSGKINLDWCSSGVIELYKQGESYPDILTCDRTLQKRLNQ
jgi:hypothetical protein